MDSNNQLAHMGNLVYLLPFSKVTGYCDLRQIWDHVAKEAGGTLRGLLLFFH